MHPLPPGPADMISVNPSFCAPNVGMKGHLRLAGEGGGGYKLYGFGKYLI